MHILKIGLVLVSMKTVKPKHRTWHNDREVQRGVDFEKSYLDDCEFSSDRLPYRIAKVNGQNIFRNFNAWETNCCKVAFS